MGRLARAALIAATVTLSVAPAFAMGDWPRETRVPPRPATSAPEIDAGSGLAALAVVVGAFAYAFERRRRA
jgi:hypothetical protein